MSENISRKIHIYGIESSESLELPLTLDRVSAGFPSPANDYIEDSIDLNKELIKNPSSTFYARVSGNSMIDMGIEDGDLLVIDKSLQPSDSCVAVCFIDGEFTLKRVELHKDYALLIPANDKYKTIKITKENDFLIWGIVRYIIKKIV